MKINISIHDTIAQQLDNYADHNGLTRSAVVVKALALLFQKEEAKDALRRAAELADDFENGKLITEEAARRYKKLLSEIEYLTKSAF